MFSNIFHFKTIDGISRKFTIHARRTLNFDKNIILLPRSFRFARPSIALVGSEPMDSRPINGVRMLLSSHVVSKFRITPSAYFSPADSAMYALA